MKLIIDTSNKEQVRIGLERGGGEVLEHSFAVSFDQAERLLPEIEGFLRGQGVGLTDLEEILVNNQGDSFTALRIGVITANALAYALDIPVRPLKGQSTGRFVEPEYDREPNIT